MSSSCPDDQYKSWSSVGIASSPSVAPSKPGDVGSLGKNSTSRPWYFSTRTLLWRAYVSTFMYSVSDLSKAFPNSIFSYFKIGGVFFDAYKFAIGIETGDTSGTRSHDVIKDSLSFVCICADEVFQ